MTKFLSGLTLNTRAVLAYMIVLFTFGFLFTLAKVSVPPDNRDVLNTAAGLTLGTLGAVIGFYFGSSKGEADSNASNLKPPADPTKIS